jgi:hypothetical protein
MLYERRSFQTAAVGHSKRISRSKAGERAFFFGAAARSVIGGPACSGAFYEV